MCAPREAPLLVAAVALSLVPALLEVDDEVAEALDLARACHASDLSPTKSPTNVLAKAKDEELALYSAGGLAKLENLVVIPLILDILEVVPLVSAKAPTELALLWSA